jgi:hypothetical protein
LGDIYADGVAARTAWSEAGLACWRSPSAKVTEGIYVHAFNREAREARIREAMSRAQNGTSSS